MNIIGQKHVSNLLRLHDFHFGDDNKVLQRSKRFRYSN